MFYAEKQEKIRRDHLGMSLQAIELGPWIQSLYSLLPIAFWTQPRIQAFLSKVPNDSMIILDLSSDEIPMWSQTNSYYGKPFIWCMLHNYGDVRAIYGNISRVASGPVDARNTPGNTMVGVGITAEGIETNPVIYDLMVKNYG